MDHAPTRGLLALASAALFGATPPMSKLLLAEMSPFLLAGLLYLGAGLGLAVVAAVRRLSRTGEDRRSRDLHRWSGSHFLRCETFMPPKVFPLLLV